jgi:hypothetical protein
MGLNPGQTNNPGGRPLGSKNKTTEEIRQAILSIVNNNIDKLQNDIDSLQPKDRVILFERLLKYVIPPLNNTSVTSEVYNDSGVSTEELRILWKESLKHGHE